MVVGSAIKWRSSDSDMEFGQMLFELVGDYVEIVVSYQNEGENIWDEINVAMPLGEFQKLLGRLETEFIGYTER